MKQDGTMAEFWIKFERVSTLLSNIIEELLMGAFVNGLQEEIRVEVRMMEA